MDIKEFLQHLVNGISLGSLYALLAIGYTLVYGILRLINFAHGDIFMISTYAGFYLMSSAILPWWIAFLLAIILTCILGILVEKAAYRPLRDAPRISLLISSIGMSYLIENLAIVFFGGRPKTFPIPAIFDRIITIGSVKIPTLSFI